MLHPCLLWLDRLLYAFPSGPGDPPIPAVGTAMETAVARGLSLPGRRGNQELPAPGPASMGLATERQRLEAVGLPQDAPSREQEWSPRGLHTPQSGLRSIAAVWLRVWTLWPVPCPVHAFVPSASNGQRFGFQHSENLRCCHFILP